MAHQLPYLRQPPFDSLSDTERERLSRDSQIVYLDSLQPLPDDWVGDFFIVIKGQVYQQQGDELRAILNVGDWFDSRQRTLSGIEPSFISQQQSLLYRINGQTLSSITEQNSVLNNLLFADLSARVAQQQARLANNESQQLLHQPIESLGQHIRPPQFIEDTASLQAAATAMIRANAKHVLVNSHRPLSDNERARLREQGVAEADMPTHNPTLGIITQTDICHAVSECVDMATTPVVNYTNFDLQMVHIQQDVSEALLTMLDHRVHRLPIVGSHGEIVGILGQTELMNYLTNHSNLIVARIEQAHTIDELQIAVDLIGKYIRHQQKAGMKTYIISRTVQSLNSQIFAKIWQLIVPALTFNNTCLVVMGSEGRGEQIIRNDQDNALIVRDGYHDEHLPQYAEQFNQATAKLGYPLCDGNIMISNPLWRKSLSEFEQQIRKWFTQGDAQSMIWLATLCDAQPISGDRSLFDALREHFQVTYQNYATSNFINRFAKPILQFGDSSHFWQKFTGTSDNDIDLKKAGIFPIVHGVRTLSLEQGIEVTNTRRRLRELVNQHVLDDTTATNLADALDFFLAKRLEAALTTTDKSAWKVNPHDLSAMDKDLLKEALAIVKDFKALITLRYRLDIF